MKQIDELKLAALFDKAKAEAMALLSDVPTVPIVSVEPEKPIATDYTKTYRYSLAQNAWKFSLFKPGVYKSFPPAKGSVNLDYYKYSDPSPLLGMPRITKDGLLFLNNQKNTLFMAEISEQPQYPFEIWDVWHKPDYFMDEKMREEPNYDGEMGWAGGGIRTLPDAAPNHIFPKAVFPVNKPSIFRRKLTENPKGVCNVELWIDGVKQINPLAVTTYYRNHFYIGVGVNTNNAYMGWHEVLHMPVLSDADAAKVTAELQAEYKPLNLPIATNIKYTTSGSNTTVSWECNMPTSSFKIRWVNMSKGIELATYVPEYDGKLTVPSTFIGRAEVTLIGVNGEYFDIPSTSKPTRW